MNTKSVSLESAEKGITASFSLRELSDGESEQVKGGATLAKGKGRISKHDDHQEEQDMNLPVPTD